MLLLGIDIGTSSVKVSVVDAATRKIVASAQCPDEETAVVSLHPGWAEQEPACWWQHTQQAILKANATGKYQPQDIAAIGIAYQMHGLVCVGKNQQPLRPSIIWCDSRAVEIGDAAFDAIGHEACLSHLLNSPGNFTASKLAWVKENEPSVYERTSKIMLPGDYIAMMLTGEATTSVPALSEGIFWDFKEEKLSEQVMKYFGFDRTIIPAIHPVFASHGELKPETAKKLGLKPGIPISYKAGDQPNNAFALNVLRPGEVAATAGTSGVVYAVSDSLQYDPGSRVNTFAHVNHCSKNKRLGVLACINGCGMMNRYIKEKTGNGLSYTQMNEAAAEVPTGSDGLCVLPFGNGAERIFHNRILGASFHHLDLNAHTPAHLFRATQEGIACAMYYGIQIMQENGIHPTVIRAGKANMFLSSVFTETFVGLTGVPVELHEGDGSTGAALGAGVGAGIFSGVEEAFEKTIAVQTIELEATEARTWICMRLGVNVSYPNHKI